MPAIAGFLSCVWMRLYPLTIFLLKVHTHEIESYIRQQKKRKNGYYLEHYTFICFIISSNPCVFRKEKIQ
jgi:hypothetical protein